MHPVEIKPGVYYLGAQHWDRRLFDELIPLPDGTSYNSYLVLGERKTALIDSVHPDKEDELISALEEMKIERIDYLVSNHAEQDHSGAIPAILDKYPEAKLVTNEKCKEFLEVHLGVKDSSFLTISDGEELSVGGKTLQFIIAPWVHWPETMFTYLKEDKVLFTCDFLGSHLASTKAISNEDGRTYLAAKRYYAEIMMPFREHVKRHLKRIRELDVEVIAPSHGPIYMNPEFILSAYEDWSSDDVKNQVTVAFVSMYGSTRKAIEVLVDALLSEGIEEVHLFNLTEGDLGEMAMSLVDSATLVIGTPAFLVGPHPVAAYFLSLVNSLRPKTRFVGVISSFGWGSRVFDEVRSSLRNLRVEFLDPVLMRGFPREEDLSSVRSLARKIYERHKELGIV